MRGDAPGSTTPEELLAAAHAVCFGIGLRSVIGRQESVGFENRTTAIITAEKGPDGIRIRGSHLRGVVSGLEALALERLAEIEIIVEHECTISAALRGSVSITHEVVAD